MFGLISFFYLSYFLLFYCDSSFKIISSFLSQKLQTFNIKLLFLWPKSKQLSILIFFFSILSIRPHDKGILFVAKNNFGRQEGLANKIDIIEYFQQIVVILVIKGDMLIPKNLITNLKQVLFPLLDLLNNKRSQLSVVFDLLTKLHHYTFIILLKNGLLYYLIFTKHRAKDLIHASRALIVRCMKLKWHCLVLRSYIYRLMQSSILS